jgi:hypothetical protein
VPDSVLDHQVTLQQARRRGRVEDLSRFRRELADYPDGGLVEDALVELAQQMHFDVGRNGSDGATLTQVKSSWKRSDCLLARWPRPFASG